MSQFVHLHLHTQYSLLDGANKISSVVSRAAALGQPAIAMTDHGNLHGAIEFYQTAKKEGIKPIIGCELYVTGGSRFERKTKAQGGEGTHHLTVLAESYEGYLNLCRLVSLSYKEGFYFKPRVDHELLATYSKGLIVLSGCLASELSKWVRAGDDTKARELLAFYDKHFKNRFFLEIQPHQIAEQKALNSGCIELARDLGMPLVATTDCHYCEADDHYAQEVLMCISTGKQVTDPTRIRHEGVTLFLKSADEMRAEFGGELYVDEAIKNSLAIAERCNVEFDFSKHFMPRFSEKSEDEHGELMASLAREGLEKRLEKIRSATTEWGEAEEQEYLDRLQLEIDLINKMGFASYFLVVSDFIVWAKEQEIPVGPGRGSVAGSLVAYAMRITDVDPISNKLLFERFLNPERVSLPDIDVDFCIFGREKVIQYVSEKYGTDRVAQIATFGTLKAKAALKDVGRALGMPYAETDKIAQLVPAPRQGFDYPLAEAIKMEKRLEEYAKGEGREFITLAMKLEGLTRHTSTHAAGVVIGDRPLMDMLPMMVDKEGNDVTQYSMGYVEKIGLVKFDFLGLKTLSVLHLAVKLVKESQGHVVQLDEIPLDDPTTFSILCAGNTTGVFQLESGGITDMTVRLKPNSFDDLVAILALYRPGPLDAGMVDHYIERKHGRQEVRYLHPLMESILSDTYGIILYQEQIMQLARDLAGYSLAEADMLRRAMGKKKPEEMAKQKVRFMQGAEERKIDRDIADEIFGQMETFARYGFNRSHSVAYALVSYQTAYMKAHFGVEFMAALMSFEMSDSDKTLKNLNECRKQGITVLPPDVNGSIAGFSVQERKVRYGLEAVKGVGERAVDAILTERKKGGAFESFEDFLMRVELKTLNKRVLESLVKCGAFDNAGKGSSRRELFEALDDCMKQAQSLQRGRDSSQIGLFGSDTSVAQVVRRVTELPEWPVNQRLNYEKEALGFYITGHPLEKYRQDLKRLGALDTQAVKTGVKRDSVRIGGIITALKLKNTKRGDRYASFLLEDQLGTLEALVWPDKYRDLGEKLETNEPVVLQGRAEVTEERANFIVEKLELLTALRDATASYGCLELRSEDDLALIERLPKLFRKYEGPCQLRVTTDFFKRGEFVLLRDEDDRPIKVQPSEELCEESEELFGRPALTFY
jgi:DNA polymerase III subunit alpha